MTCGCDKPEIPVNKVNVGAKNGELDGLIPSKKLRTALINEEKSETGCGAPFARSGHI